MYGEKLVKLCGLNKRSAAVLPSDVSHLEEVEMDGKIGTNVFLRNTRWFTAAHTLDEVHALLYPPKEEKDDEEDQLRKWRALAQAKRQMQLDVEAAMRLSNIDSEKYKVVSNRSEKVDKAVKIEILLEERGDDDHTEG